MHPGPDQDKDLHSELTRPSSDWKMQSNSRLPVKHEKCGADEKSGAEDCREIDRDWRQRNKSGYSGTDSCRRKDGSDQRTYAGGGSTKGLDRKWIKQSNGNYGNDSEGCILTQENRRQSIFHKDGPSFSSSNKKTDNKRKPAESGDPHAAYEHRKITEGTTRDRRTGTERTANVAYNKENRSEQVSDIQYSSEQMLLSSFGPMRRKPGRHHASGNSESILPHDCQGNHPLEHNVPYQDMRPFKHTLGMHRENLRRPYKTNDLCEKEDKTELIPAQVDSSPGACLLAKEMQGDEYKNVELIDIVVPLEEPVDIKVTSASSPLKFYCQLINAYYHRLKSKLDKVQFECKK